MFLSGFGELNWESYTVQPGDTLSAIASKYGTSVDIIAGQNAIANPNLIQVGQQLDIPLEDTEFAAYMAKLSKEPNLPVAQMQEPTSVTPISTVATPVVTSTLPVWLQGDIGGIKKVYVYPLMAAIGLVLIMPALRKSSPTRRVSMQPA